MGGFLDYIPGDSFLYRLNPLTKLLLSFTLCLCCFLSKNILFVLGIIALNLLLAASAGVLSRSARILGALAKLSLVLFLLQVPFVRSGRVLLSLPLSLTVTDEGVAFSLLFSLRLIAATLPLALMLSVTKMSDLTGVCVDRLKIPYRYTFAFTTAIRFIPIFTNEMSEIMEAQTARGVDFDTRNFFKKIRLLLPLCVPLLISSVKRIDSGAVAAELRGFNCRKSGGGRARYPFGSPDVLAACAAAVVLLLSRVFVR